MTATPWLVICSCGWERACSSEWAAQSIATLHPQLASMDVAHVTRVEGPGRDDSARRNIKSGAPDIEYRGHFIDVQSYESEGRRWRPKAILSIYRGGTLHQQILSAPGEVLRRVLNTLREEKGPTQRAATRRTLRSTY